ncbi:hypothetical protein AC579_2786 [Pseudocercospora musae]|uniref:Uncharacterized protein n=1 Tax=Pseudocercospora musae TaxID=113226 RepID=A0A139HZG0_9PEZI|nr:hypothetical protein AC579_2786 [Pseudocercospora musae]
MAWLGMLRSVAVHSARPVAHLQSTCTCCILSPTSVALSFLSSFSPPPAPRRPHKQRPLVGQHLLVHVHDAMRCAALRDSEHAGDSKTDRERAELGRRAVAAAQHSMIERSCWRGSGQARQ